MLLPWLSVWILLGGMRCVYINSTRIQSSGSTQKALHKPACLGFGQHGPLGEETLRDVQTVLRMTIRMSAKPPRIPYGSCTLGYKFLFDGTQHGGQRSCYLLLNRSSGWRSAERECQANKGHLVSVETKEELEHIKASFLKSDADPLRSFWTSGRHIGRNRWVWRATGKMVGYVNWAIVQPTLVTDTNGAISLHRKTFQWYKAWTNIPCTGICEKPSNFKLS